MRPYHNVDDSPRVRRRDCRRREEEEEDKRDGLRKKDEDGNANGGDKENT